MSGARIAQIEDRLTELVARFDADNVVLQALAGHLAVSSSDWRDFLDTVRMSAEASLRNTQYDLPPDEAETMLRLGLAHVEEMFRSLRKFMLAHERQRQARQ